MNTSRVTVWTDDWRLVLDFSYDSDHFFVVSNNVDALMEDGGHILEPGSSAALILSALRGYGYANGDFTLRLPD